MRRKTHNRVVRRLVALPMLALMVALAACSSGVKNVDSTSATATTSGTCSAGLSGTWMHEFRGVTVATPWTPVGERKFFNCSAGTASNGDSPITGLKGGRTYQIRISAAWSANGQSASGYFDSAGTNGGTNYTTFTTPEEVQFVSLPPETFRTTDPETGAVLAQAAGNCGRPKEISNPRVLESTAGTDLVKINLTTAWKYCNGQITKMYEAGASCVPTSWGLKSGWSCGAVEKKRAISTGGNPEHGAYTYTYVILWQNPIPTLSWDKSSKFWCATNQISGSGAHKRTGSCDIQPW